MQGMHQDTAVGEELLKTWTLPYAARLGSSVRSQGLYLEIRERLPKTLRTFLTVKAGELILRVPASDPGSFSKASAVVVKAIEEVVHRPVIPRELEDILGISTSERRRWLADGRLPSAGTRTVKLRDRGTITFHIFEPSMVQDLLDNDAIEAWRADDAEKAIENRRNVARRRKSESGHAIPSVKADIEEDDERFTLRGWGEFERNGPLG